MGMSPRLLRPRASGSVPQSIANLTLWLDASDNSTITTDSGAVSQWRDKSSTKRIYSQSTANNRPVVASAAIGTRQSIRFDGTNDRLTSTEAANDLVAPCTVFIVGRKDAATADGGLFTLDKTGANSYDSDSLWCISTNAAGAAFRTYGGTGTSWAPSIGSAADIVGSFIWSVVTANNTNSATARNRITGQSQTDSSYTLSATPSNTGSSVGVISSAGGYIHFLNGDIAEVIGYSRALTTAEQSTLAAYLAKKYGLTLA